MAEEPSQALSHQILAILRCPVTRSPLQLDGDTLVADLPEGAGLRYPIRDGIPVLLMDEATLPDEVDSLEAFKAKYAEVIPQTTPG